VPVTATQFPWRLSAAPVGDYPANHQPPSAEVAPDLAADHTVVLADLRGYGDSGKPAPGERDENCSSGRWPPTGPV
jgi:pimeloyl-ACP methyl ester carboxylesterase